MPANSNFHLHISYKEWVDSLLKKSLSVQGGFLPFTACQSGLFKKIQIGGNGLWRTKKPEKKENGGSVSPAVEVQLPWRQSAADRLVTSLALYASAFSGCRGQIENALYSYQARCRAVNGKWFFHTLPTLNAPLHLAVT